MFLVVHKSNKRINLLKIMALIENNLNENHSDDENREIQDPLDVLGNGQLVKRVLKRSSLTRRPAQGDLIAIRFKAKLENGTVVAEEDKFEMHLGDMEVILGLDIILEFMYVDEIAELLVHPRFAYGRLGLKNVLNSDLDIPPQATLIFVMHLLEANTEDIANLDPEMKAMYCARKRACGNFWFRRNDYDTAVQLYKRALEYIDNYEGEDSRLTATDLLLLYNEVLSLHNNLSIALIKMGKYDRALKYIDNVLLNQPDDLKVLYRKGLLFECEGDDKNAIVCYKKALRMTPLNSIIGEHIATLVWEIEQFLQEKKMLRDARSLRQKQQQNTILPKLAKFGIMGAIIAAGIYIATTFNSTSTEHDLMVPPQ